MALSRSEIVKRSEEKHGIKVKSFKLPKTIVEEIEQLARYPYTAKPTIIQAVELFKKSKE